LTRSLPLRSFVLAVVAVLAVGACSRGPQPAATVDGEDITDAQLQRDMALYTFLTALNGGTCGQPIEGETAESACARFALTNGIREDLVKHYAQANDVAVTDATVSGVLTQLETSLGGAETLDQQLKGADLTRADLTAIAHRLLLFDEVQSEVGADSVTDEQLRQIYDADPSQYSTLEVSHILVESQKEAEQIAAEATPDNFAELAKERSTDTTSGQNGGSLGVMAETMFTSSFDPTFVEASLALEPGQISQPVQTQFGWHVIDLVSRDTQPFEQVRDQLLATESATAFDTWMRDQLKTAEITVNPKYGSFDEATGEVNPVRSTKTDSPFQGPSGSPSPAVSP
jgi:hypothetical protein